MKSAPIAVALFGFVSASLIGVWLWNEEKEAAERRAVEASPSSSETGGELSGDRSTEVVGVEAQSSDFESRYQVLLGRENGPSKVEAIARLFEEWGRADGEAAFAYAKTLSGRDRIKYLESAAIGWARRSPREAWNAMMEISNQGMMLVGSVGALLGAVAEMDSDQATRFLFEVDSQYNRTRLFDKAVSRLETDDQRRAMLGRLLSSEVEGRAFLVESLFKDWGRYDSEAPIAELGRLGDSKLSQKAMAGILEGWASVDGQGAFEYVLESGDAGLIRNALVPIAKEWAAACTADELETLIGRVAELEQADEVLKGLVPTLSQANPQLALAGISTLKSETARANHTRDALSQWAIADLDAAEAYYRELPAGRTKEYAIWGLFNPAVHHGEPVERIVGFVDALEDPVSIGKALFSMSEYTMAVNKGEMTDRLAWAVRQYVEDHDELPEEVRARILENLAKRKG
ncbi:hypothetical protein [Pelagicoccus sp. SDUM812003]|uniref:hypothetical protein n=1 Tax=Pelagicoccus sp. SDUM812003 TaxID=3041267 RepID=UPI00280DBD3D|nr:hypothetical protein [Pelagicoccus sp. SDUM812003]MDQ8204962.1 hypothetical protein [Pelagicoccus sp. SDUM812003]